MDANSVHQLITNKTDKEIAAEHKENIAKSSEALLMALTNASRDGFKAQVNFGENAFGQVVIQQLAIFKQF